MQPCGLAHMHYRASTPKLAHAWKVHYFALCPFLLSCGWSPACWQAAYSYRFCPLICCIDPSCFLARTEIVTTDSRRTFASCRSLIPPIRHVDSAGYPRSRGTWCRHRRFSLSVSPSLFLGAFYAQWTSLEGPRCLFFLSNCIQINQKRIDNSYLTLICHY